MSDPNEMFAIVPYSNGKAPEEAIIKGNLSQVTEYIPQSIARADAERHLAEAMASAAEIALQQDEIRAHAAQILTDGMARLSERLDALVARRQARADQQRRDAEAAEIAAYRDNCSTRLPDPDAPDLPAALSDDGDLKATKPPPDTENYDPEDGR